MFKVPCHVFAERELMLAAFLSEIEGHKKHQALTQRGQLKPDLL